MKKSLPSLAALLLALVAAIAPGQEPSRAAAPEPAPAAEEPQGGLLIEHMISSLEAAPSISAKIRHRVELLGRPLVGTGEYVQQGRGGNRQFHFSLELRTALSATRMEHTCDGRQLWLWEEFDNRRSLAIVDVERMQRATPKVGASQPAATWWLSLGGLPKLATSLKDSFQFGEVVANRLDELPVWSVEGRWRPERLAQFLPEQAESIRTGQEADLSKLTPNIPHKVVVHVGCDDLFPYRIEYWRAEASEAGAIHEKLMAVMEWYEVRIAAPIEPARFAFRSTVNLQPVDKTQEWLDRLGLQDPPPIEATRRPRTRL